MLLGDADAYFFTGASPGEMQTASQLLLLETLLKTQNMHLAVCIWKSPTKIEEQSQPRYHIASCPEHSFEVM